MNVTEAKQQSLEETYSGGCCFYTRFATECTALFGDNKFTRVHSAILMNCKPEVRFRSEGYLH